MPRCFGGTQGRNMLKLMTAWIVILWSCVLLEGHAKNIRTEMLNSNTIFCDTLTFLF